LELGERAVGVGRGPLEFGEGRIAIAIGGVLNKKSKSRVLLLYGFLNFYNNPNTYLYILSLYPSQVW
jgi:hypothetical protein